MLNLYIYYIYGMLPNLNIQIWELPKLGLALKFVVNIGNFQIL